MQLQLDRLKKNVKDCRSFFYAWMHGPIHNTEPSKSRKENVFNCQRMDEQGTSIFFFFFFGGGGGGSGWAAQKNGVVIGVYIDYSRSLTATRIWTLAGLC